MRVWVCVCVRERGRDSESVGVCKIERERGRDSESVGVCVREEINRSYENKSNLCSTSLLILSSTMTYQNDRSLTKLIQKFANAVFVKSSTDLSVKFIADFLLNVVTDFNTYLGSRYNDSRILCLLIASINSRHKCDNFGRQFGYRQCANL